MEMIVVISRGSLSVILLTLALAAASHAEAADPPCDTYPVAKQTTGVAIWKSLNQEDGPLIAQFGLDQLKRREEKSTPSNTSGKICPSLRNPPKIALNGFGFEWKKSRPYKSSVFDFSTARPPTPVDPGPRQLAP